MGKRLTAICVIAVSTSLLFTGCSSDKKADPNAVAISINSKDFLASEVAQELKFIKSKYQISAEADESIWKDASRTGHLKKLASDEVYDSFLSRAALEKIVEDEKFSLSEEAKARIEQEKNSYVEENGKEQYDEMTEKYNVTDDMLYNNVYQTTLKGELKKYFYGEYKAELKDDASGVHYTLVSGKEPITEEEIYKKFEGDYLHAKHILIATTDQEGNKLSDEQLGVKKKLAQDIIDKIAAGEDFDSLVDKYGEDPGMKSDKYKDTGYYFEEGDMVDEFYQGTLRIKEGEISDIVESEFGYHIIKRLPLERSYFDGNKSAILNDMSQSRFDEKLDKAKKECVVSNGALFNKINIYNCEEYLSK